MDKYKNKYRISSARLLNWDYRNNGAYFITICTTNREHFFGNITDGIMNLNEMGELAHKFWAEIPSHFPFVELGNFVIMPDHTHGILIINNLPDIQLAKSMDDADHLLDDDLKKILDDDLKNDSDRALDNVQTLQCNVSTQIPSQIPPPLKNEKMANISPKPGSISTIIRSYKSVVSKHARKIHADFGWQPRFHDHIIRNSRSFDRIQNYISRNPENWNKSKKN